MPKGKKKKKIERHRKERFVKKGESKQRKKKILKDFYIVSTND